MSTLPEQSELSRRLGAMLGSVAAIEPLESGTGGNSYLVATARGRFVAKVFAAGSSALLGPAAQFDLLRELAAAGVAPRPAAVDPVAGILVTAHIAEGKHPGAAMLREPETIGLLARMLHRLHSQAIAGPASVAPYSPLVYAGTYLGKLGGVDALSPADRSRFAELMALAADFGPADPDPARFGPASLGPPGAVLCHNDLTAENILFAGEPGAGIRAGLPMLIDFDFAVLAPPILDLASLAFMNAFGPTEVGLLLDAYFAGKVPFSLAEFARVERLQHLLAHFWSLTVAGAGAASVGQYRIRDD